MSNNNNNNGPGNYEPNEEGYEQMVNYLENVLTRQVEKLRKYDIDGALALAEEANDLALGIQESGILGREDFTEERGRIMSLYREIGLIIASERSEVAEKLKAIRKGIKTLEAYSN